MTNGFSFAYGPSVRCGPGSTAQMAELLPPGPVLFVTDKQLLDHGLADAALAEAEKLKADAFALTGLRLDVMAKRGQAADALKLASETVSHHPGRRRGGRSRLRRGQPDGCREGGRLSAHQR